MTSRGLRRCQRETSFEAVLPTDVRIHQAEVHRENRVVVIDVHRRVMAAEFEAEQNGPALMGTVRQSDEDSYD